MAINFIHIRHEKTGHTSRVPEDGLRHLPPGWHKYEPEPGPPRRRTVTARAASTGAQDQAKTAETGAKAAETAEAGSERPGTLGKPSRKTANGGSKDTKE